MTRAWVAAMLLAALAACAGPATHDDPPVVPSLENLPQAETA